MPTIFYDVQRDIRTNSSICLATIDNRRSRVCRRRRPPSYRFALQWVARQCRAVLLNSVDGSTRSVKGTRHGLTWLDILQWHCTKSLVAFVFMSGNAVHALLDKSSWVVPSDFSVWSPSNAHSVDFNSRLLSAPIIAVSVACPEQRRPTIDVVKRRNVWPHRKSAAFWRNIIVSFAPVCCPGSRFVQQPVCVFVYLSWW